MLGCGGLGKSSFTGIGFRVSRLFSDWLTAYCDYASFSEAPRHMHFWAGVSALAGALRRRIWIDQYSFKWFPNHYIIFVAPPDIVSKTTTIDIAYNLLRRVPEITIGPNVVTWQSLVQFMAQNQTSFEVEPGVTEAVSAITISSSELGNLLNTQDRQMVDMLITLWDGKPVKKLTKASGSDIIPNPLLNLAACTTPAWITGNIPDYLLEGGLLSRCLFVYADKKAKCVAYPGLSVPPDILKSEQSLALDLITISQLSGPFTLSPTALDWGRHWYESLYGKKVNGHSTQEKDRLTRPQTHIHKLALVLSAARRDTRIIEAEDLQDAMSEILTLAEFRSTVVDAVGKTSDSVQADRLIIYVRERGRVEVTEAYRLIHSHFPKLMDFEAIMRGASRAGYFRIQEEGGKVWLISGDPK